MERGDWAMTASSGGASSGEAYALQCHNALERLGVMTTRLGSLDEVAQTAAALVKETSHSLVL